MADYDDIRSRLEGIAEELSDLALDALRDAVRAGATKSEVEKRITRARNAVQKAARLLTDDHSADD
jgi:hypothetical protein